MSVESQPHIGWKISWEKIDDEKLEKKNDAKDSL